MSVTGSVGQQRSIEPKTADEVNEECNARGWHWRKGWFGPGLNPHLVPSALSYHLNFSFIYLTNIH